ncbi:carbohydrate ABC transporter permease [Microbacterium sp. SORGH_AS_0888]|uniref:carbohydrate ABC transporter permease n=1 Tax=Microbacterium sp. SORGH_AS_0888 TaxID=3041791 RepID=UPI00277D731F|nr:multiple sugar transport system permease protein [Microbacterium sp. SORGH_AS_0888]
MAGIAFDRTGSPTGTPRRRRRNGTTDSGPRKSPLLTIVMAIFLIYSFLPLLWLVISSTKTQQSLFGSFGLWFSGPFALFDNIAQVVTYDDGIFLRWFLNTIIYVVIGAGGATLLATLAGYGLAKYSFPGKKIVFAVILGAIAVPGTALAVPTFLLFSQLGLTNTMWAIIIPSLISPFGLYLIWVYAVDSVPTELLEAARVDGSGELRTFFTISLRLLAPGIVTVALFAIVATWNNYFLPLIMLNDPSLFPLTIGLQQWNLQAVGVSSQPIFNLVITGSLLTIVPIVIAFLLLQRFWQSGLSAGSVKQ